MDVLDQIAIVDCNSVVEKCSFHWNGSAVSYSILCLNYKEFSEIGSFDLFD